MASVHMTEFEVARDFAAALDKVRDGAEIVVERGNQPVAIIRAPGRSGRLVADILRDAEQQNSDLTLDAAFGADLEDVIASPQPGKPPSWE
jgi:antitoxin (DNA-binding transcriptional repressor) of toxin-antitoxin stability system